MCALRNTSIETLHQCVERLRQRFAEKTFDVLPEGVHCTFSAGLSLLQPEDDLEVCLNDADQALYLAKNSGRNRSEWHDPSYA